MSKWTNEDIAIKTQSEGLGYMIQHYKSTTRKPLPLGMGMNCGGISW
jgi:hypothetical protein